MKWAFLKFEKPHCHLIETKNIIRIRTKIEYFNQILGFALHTDGLDISEMRIFEIGHEIK